MVDCLIVGGGVIGLTLACELAAAGKRVRVLERGHPGQESSWAGAGILPPAGDHPRASAWERLAALSCRLHPEWSRLLLERTGVDNGFRRCGGYYIARDATGAAELAELARYWKSTGVAAEPVAPGDFPSRGVPLSAAAQRGVGAAWFLPDEAQLRNPRHMRALVAYAGQLGVAIEEEVSVLGFEVRGGRIAAALTSSGRREAATYCVTGGAWSAELLEGLGVEIAVRPLRGQIAALKVDTPLFSSVLNEGKRYLVPRDDGVVLVGSTEEEAGFDKRTTAMAQRELLDFAFGLVPQLASAAVEKCWAGLRPATKDGLPYLGRVPEVENGFVAAGHYRAGLLLSPGTAVVMKQLMVGEKTDIDLSDFSPTRRP